jgi:ArsR family transcriptional regulator, arsenate/arsenite/antimonite-responsive transcriptional repressor
VVISAQAQQQAEGLSVALAAMAEPHRLLMLRQLRRGPRTAGNLARALGIGPSLASHHLTALVEAGLVTRRRAGSFVCYTAETRRVRELHQRLGVLAGATGPASDAAARVADPC